MAEVKVKHDRAVERADKAVEGVSTSVGYGDQPVKFTDRDRMRLNLLADSLENNLIESNSKILNGGYARLYLATLISAVRNFEHRVPPKKLGRAKWVQDRDWLVGYSTEPFSLDWICTALHYAGIEHLHAASIRVWAKRKLRGGWKR